MLHIELADVMLPETEKVSVDYRQDSLPLTAGLYEAFLAKGKKGRDGLLVYLHLLCTYRRQGTNRPWATKSYLEQGLKMGHRRLSIARSLLSKMGLIEYLRSPRGEHGRMGKVYTKLNLVPNPSFTTSAEIGPVEKSPESTTGPRTAGMETDDKCLKKKTKEEVEAIASSPAKSKKPRTPHGRLRVLFSELYKKKTGAASAPFNPAAAGQLRNDIKRLGEGKLARCLRFLFDHPPARMTSFAYMALHTFLPEAEKALEAEDRRLRLLKTCKVCGKTSETTGIDCPKCGEPDAYQVKEAHRAAK